MRAGSRWVVRCFASSEEASFGNGSRQGWKRETVGKVAVGTAIADRSPHRSLQALLTHTAPTLDAWRLNGSPDRDAPAGGVEASEQGAVRLVHGIGGRFGCGAPARAQLGFSGFFSGSKRRASELRSRLAPGWERGRWLLRFVPNAGFDWQPKAQAATPPAAVPPVRGSGSGGVARLPPCPDVARRAAGPGAPRPGRGFSGV